MQLTEAALPGAASSLHVLSCLLGANRASSVHRQWHCPKCLPGVSDVAVALGLRASLGGLRSRSVGAEQAFWRGNAVQHHSIPCPMEQVARRLWLFLACPSCCLFPCGVVELGVLGRHCMAWLAGSPRVLGVLISRSRGSPGPAENTVNSTPPSFFKD